MSAIRKELIDIANKYGCKVKRSLMCEKNEGASAGDLIMLGEYDNEDCENIAFFHELAHCTFHLTAEKIFKVEAPLQLSFLSTEGVCWEYGLFIAKANGYEWDLDSEAYKYAYDRYFTYVNNEYDENSYGEKTNG